MPKSSFRRLLLRSFFLFLLSLSGLLAFSQQVTFQTTGNNVTVVIDSMDKYLVPGDGVDTEEPRYLYLWITNDGQFYRTNHKNNITHNFDTAVIGTSSPNNAVVRTYATAVYSDHGDDEPPKRIIDTTTVDSVAEAPNLVQLVQPGSSVLLSRDNYNLVPEDTVAFVLSFRNILAREFESAISGHLLLFYDSPLYDDKGSVIRKINKPDKVKPKADIVADVNRMDTFYTRHAFQESMVFNNRFFLQSRGAVAVENAGTRDFYRNVLVYRFSNIPPDSLVENHLFVEMRNDSLHLDALPGTSGLANFLAVALLDPIPSGEIFLDPPPPSPADSALLAGINFSEFLSTPLTIPDGEGGERELQLRSSPVEVSQLEATVSRSKDPNAIRLEACACPPEGGGRQKVVVRVDFENEGPAPTTGVLIEVPFPEEFDLSSVRTDSLFSVFPPMETLNRGVNITTDPAANAVLIEFPGLQLQGVKEGINNFRARSGHAAFTIMAKAGVELAAIPEVQACITFRDAIGENPEICTLPKSVELYSSEALGSPMALLALDCFECEASDIRASDAGGGSFLWLLMLFLILFVLALYYAANNSSWGENEGG